MALQATFGQAQAALRRPSARRIFPNNKARQPHDLAPTFWSIALPSCLLFWAAVAYGIHSAF